MFLLRSGRIDLFYDAIKALCEEVSETANLKCSNEMFSITAASQTSPNFIVSLQITPQFFHHILCNQNYRTTISLRRFLVILEEMLPKKASSITFTLSEIFPRVFLQFHVSGDDKQPVVFRDLKLLPLKEEDVGHIDYSTFLSIDSEAFGDIVRKFNGSKVLCVTMTKLQVKFSVGLEEIILIAKEIKGIIGGIAAEDETQFLITLVPIECFNKLINRSKMIWFFKTTDSRSVINVCVDLFARLMINFP